MASTASTTLSSIREFWRNFDIISLQKKLDGEATELAGRQDKSEISRKMLVDLSREFKKTTPENVRKQVAPLLKSFQGEVDSLSKRSKAAETAFLSLYKRVVEIPDPLPALDQCVANQSKVSKFHDYEIENKKLRDTLSEYNNEFAEVKNQEVTINRLREKLKEYEDKIEETAQLRVQEKEKEMEKSFAERERQLQETQLEVAKKLGETELQVANLKSALESTQSELFDVKSKLDEENEARSSAVEILEADLERANQRALLSERQTESLNEQLNRLKSELEMSDERSQKNMDDAFHSISKTNLERELSAKENEITQLVDDIQRLQAAMNKMREAGNQRIASLEQQLAEKTELIIELETKLRQQADYEEIRRELDILKSVEFSRSPSIEDDSDTKDRVFEKDDRKSLEILLLEKNRGLQSENTKLKFAIEELTERHENLQKQFTDAARTLKEQQELIKQLEADLLSVHALPSTHRGQGEGESGPTTESELVSVAVQGVVKSPNIIPSEAIPVESSSSADSLLPIISSQRERFKTRNMELEAQVRHQQRQTSLLQNEIDGLRSDNVKLYEKIRFLQSYPNKGGNNREMDEIAVNKYSSQYEARLDPFAAFNKNEKQQRYLGLSAHDRVTLNMGKFILSNKIARAVTFFYTILLHCLVFLVLYKLAYTESCKRVVAEKYDTGVFEHMQNAHEMPNVFHPT
ncbi:protein CASP-like [Xenia sp. Carnegie-2017]|uniref:protein CASP-like n=1 Tax=Xenia sp. Carnegie-2017 TaxID=2897299 RepID=UPI001F04B769|nr:protein CASP-like [Xenia sp. Carnegie-2017]